MHLNLDHVILLILHFCSEIVDYIHHQHSAYGTAIQVRIIL